VIFVFYKLNSFQQNVNTETVSIKELTTSSSWVTPQRDISWRTEIWRVAEEIQSSLSSGSACYHSVQNVFLLIFYLYNKAGVWEQEAEENIRIWERRRGGRLEKTAYWGAS